MKQLGEEYPLCLLEDLCARATHSIKHDLSYIYEYIVCRVLRTSYLCHKSNIICIDAPVLATYILRRDLNLDDRAIRKVWRILGRTFGELKKVRIFENSNFNLDLTFSLRRGPVYIHRELGIPLGEADIRANVPYILIPRSMLLYIDVEAKLSERACIKLSLVYLLKKLYETGLSELAVGLGKLTLSLLEYIIFKRGSIKDVVSQFNRVIAEFTPLKDILREIAQVEDITPLEMLVHVPCMRKLVGCTLSTVVESSLNL